MRKNELRVALADFKRTMLVFREFRRAKRAPQALLAFNGGMLSFEAGGNVAVVHADGEWHVRVWTSAHFLGIFHEVPPREDPVVISCAEGKLHISTLTLGCHWEYVSAPMLNRSENPDMIDLLAMDRTVDRSEFHGTDLGKRITQAKRAASIAVTRSAKSLAKLGITEAELWEMVEIQVRKRMTQETTAPS